MPFRRHLLIFLLFLSSLAAQAQNPHSPDPDQSKTRITLTPESERTLDVLVLGLAAQDGRYFQLPEWKPFSNVAPQALKELEGEFYGLNFEMNQGGIMRRLPARTQVYIAVPDPVFAKESGGMEIPFFKHYLEWHCGWTAEDIRQRIHFFKVPTSLIWAQDAGDILGKDAQGRVVIGIGPQDQKFYIDFVQSLARTYPDKFRLFWLPKGVTAEGGDENIVLTPGGKTGYVVGIHRVLFYLKERFRASFENQPLDGAKIQKAERALSKGVFSLPLQVLPKQALTDPSLADPELFHLDMLVSFMTRGGKPQAFVPQFQTDSTDMTTGKPLDPAWLERMRRELDLVAEQLQHAGYPVYRLPFSDHPVRSPANLLKYYDPQSQGDVILMSKYPYHLDGPQAPNGVKAYQALLAAFRDGARQSQEKGGNPGFEELHRAVGEFWANLFQIEQAPNPIYQERARLFESLGYQVVDVPMFPSGAGSIHCMTLH
jgi:hypothetical protein